VTEPVEEAAPIDYEAEAAPPAKPKSDAYTAMMVLSTLFFITALALAMMEIKEFYWKS
jgi:hypothetical protein